MQFLVTVWCNQIGTVFAEMSSWTDITWHLMEKTIFQTIMESKNVRTFIMIIWISYQNYAKMHTNTTVAHKPNCMSSLSLCTVFLLICIFLHHSLNLKILTIKIPRFLLSFFWSNNLSLSLYAFLKLSRTTSLQKLFPSHCTLMI